jgi:hypothetical protein
VGKVVFNGEACLMYPGIQVGIEGPAATIRLKIIRDGLDCYDYLQILADRGGRAVADEIARDLTPSFFKWDQDWGNYMAARLHLAKAILARKPVVTSEPSP